MEHITAKLTILFEDPFWVGVYERESGGRYETCKVTFGAEPRDYEVYDSFLRHWNRLRFSPSMAAGTLESGHRNPKRLQREIRRQLQDIGIGTKAQQALKLQQEQGKQTRQARSRDMREAEQERRFALRQRKHKEKHRGH